MRVETKVKVLRAIARPGGATTAEIATATGRGQRRIVTHVSELNSILAEVGLRIKATGGPTSRYVLDGSWWEKPAASQMGASPCPSR